MLDNGLLLARRRAKLSHQIRQAVRASGLSRYRIGLLDLSTKAPRRGTEKRTSKGR